MNLVSNGLLIDKWLAEIQLISLYQTRRGHYMASRYFPPDNRKYCYTLDVIPRNKYLVPICASIWSCPSKGVMGFSAYSVLSFCCNHHLLQLFDLPQLLTVRRKSHTYLNKIKEELEKRG